MYDISVFNFEIFIYLFIFINFNYLIIFENYFYLNFCLFLLLSY